MNFIIVLLRLLGLLLLIIGYFTAVIIIGILIIALAIDIYDWADKLEKKYQRNEKS